MSAIQKALAAAVVNVCAPDTLRKAEEAQRKIEIQNDDKERLLLRLEAMSKETDVMKSQLVDAKSAQADAMLMACKAQQAAAASAAPGGLKKAASAMSVMSLASRASNKNLCPDGKRVGWLSQEELDVHYDVVIIGGGPVGVAAAVKCACLGHRAIIVDKPKLRPRDSDGLDVSFGGPTGLFSKALRDTAKHVDVPSMQSMRLDDEVIRHQVQNMCLRLAESNAAHQVKTLKNFKVDYLQATASVISCNSVMVQPVEGDEAGAPSVLATDHVLVATGSRPMRPKEIPFDDVRIFDSDTINTLNFLPKSVAILGSGIIAIEYAKIFRKLGVKVTMLVRSECQSALERIGLDHDIAAKLIDVLRTDDVDILEGTVVETWNVPMCREDGPIEMTLKSSNPNVPKTLKVDVFLAAAGRTPNTKGWGAEKLGLKLAQRGGHLEVDDRYETSVPGIFAAGDIIGPPALASTGMYQAQAAVLEVFGEGHINKYKSFPVGMWTTPECGYFGMTTAEAKKKGIDVQEGCVEYSACLRGRVFAPVGLLKLVFQVSDGVILGVHILGDDACELVHYGMDLVVQGVTIFKVMTTCFTAVTFHELFKEAALNGNSKLEFGLEWHKVLNDVGAHMDNHEHGFDLDKMKKLFKEGDTDGDGALDASELMAVFHKYGCDITRATVHNLIRLVDSGNTGTVHWDEFSKVFDIIDEIRSNSHFGSGEAEPTQDKKAAAGTRKGSISNKDQTQTNSTVAGA